MHRIVTLVVALTVASTVLVGGAMADSQYSGQAAVSDVEQSQAVGQFNVNEQDDNVAASVAVGSGNGDGFPGGGAEIAPAQNGDSGAESGDAVAIQASAQSNSNKQVAWSNAQNFNKQSQDSDDGGNNGPPPIDPEE